MLHLQRNVPPRKGRRIREDDGRRKYPFERMQVDDFFFVPNRQHSSIRSYFSTAGAKHGIKLRSEQIYARQDENDLWKPCEADTPGAVSGVGVWRVE
jgi:hypothetical protein